MSLGCLTKLTCRPLNLVRDAGREEHLRKIIARAHQSLLRQVSIRLNIDDDDIMYDTCGWGLSLGYFQYGGRQDSILISNFSPICSPQTLLRLFANMLAVSSLQLLLK